MKYIVNRGVSFCAPGGGEEIARWEVGDIIDTEKIPPPPDPSTPPLDIKWLVDKGALTKIAKEAITNDH